MVFLKNFNFIDQDIEEIVKCNSNNVINNMILCKENVQDIISYLMEIGIEHQAIKEIFMHQVGFFFKTKEEIKSSFDEYELDSIVKSLNYDVNNIELIDFI